VLISIVIEILSCGFARGLLRRAQLFLAVCFIVAELYGLAGWVGESQRVIPDKRIHIPLLRISEFLLLKNEWIRLYEAAQGRPVISRSKVVQTSLGVGAKCKCCNSTALMASSRLSESVSASLECESSKASNTCGLRVIAAHGTD